MKLGHIVLIAELALFVGVIGCGDNPCQDITDAVTKASMQKGCGGSTLSGLTAQYDPANCMLSAESAAVAEKQVACLDKVTTCDTEGMIALNVCLQDAE